MKRLFNCRSDVLRVHQPLNDEIKYRSFSLETLPKRMVIPVVLTIVLFILTIFLIIIPMLEENMMDGKREGIMHLTESAWSTLSFFHQRSVRGEMSDTEAKKQAVAYLKKLRYGNELEDYFWINDMTPVMIMHPYREDLVGQDVSGFADPAGKRLFSEMVRTVADAGSGFVDYLWQWKGDSARIVPKISFVKGFAPWGWIIGTGIYVEDVKHEIRAITRHLIITCSGILLIFMVLSGYVLWQGAKTQGERLRALEQTQIREKQLLQADKMSSLGILVAGVAHELNNPATSLMLNAPNLRKAWQAFRPVLDRHYSSHPDERICAMLYSDLGPRIDPMFKAMEDGAARIKRIVSELKDFSRPVEDDMDTAVDINPMVKKSLELTGPIVKKATHHLWVDLDEDLPQVRGNVQKLQQVMINLLVNASQALENPEQFIQVRTRKTRDARFVSIEVADSGPGVSPEALRKLKEPFFTTRRDEGGTGLGLSISEKIVNDHGGILDFSSEAGQGLTASILLPALTNQALT